MTIRRRANAALGGVLLCAMVLSGCDLALSSTHLRLGVPSFPGATEVVLDRPTPVLSAPGVAGEGTSILVRATDIPFDPDETGCDSLIVLLELDDVRVDSVALQEGETYTTLWSSPEILDPTTAVTLLFVCGAPPGLSFVVTVDVLWLEVRPDDVPG